MIRKSWLLICYFCFSINLCHLHGTYLLFTYQYAFSFLPLLHSLNGDIVFFNYQPMEPRWLFFFLLFPYFFSFFLSLLLSSLNMLLSFTQTRTCTQDTCVPFFLFLTRRTSNCPWTYVFQTKHQGNFLSRNMGLCKQFNAKIRDKSLISV